MLTKTEQGIMDQINDAARGYFVATTKRELEAVKKLIDRGLVKVMSTVDGKSDVYYSKFGSRNSVSRQTYSREVKVVKA
jgi:hypothetical protein